MSKILFAVVAVALAQVAVGRVVRDTAATTTTAADSWENAWNSANVTFTQFHDSFLNLVGVKSDQELMDKAKAKFNEFETDLSTQFNKLSEEAKPLQGKAEELFNQFKGKVNVVMDDLKSKNPDYFSGDAKKIQDAADRSLRAVINSTQKLREDLAKEGQEMTPNFEATLKAIYDSSLKTVNELKTSAQNAVATLQNKTN